MKICKYGEYDEFLMDKAIEEEIDAIIVLAKLSNWRVCYLQERKILSREIQIRMPFYDTVHEIRIQISCFNNRAKQIVHSVETSIYKQKEVATIITKAAVSTIIITETIDSCFVKNLNKVSLLLKMFKLSIIKCKKECY